MSLQKTQPKGKGKHIVVFTGDLSFSVRRTIVDIDRQEANCRWLIAVHEPRKSISVLFKNQRRNLRYNGWRWIPYQISDILHRLRKTRKKVSIESSIGSEYTMAALERMANVRVERVKDIHSTNSIEIIKSFEPLLGLSLAAPILKSSLFELPSLGTLNLHKGKLPDYRGMPPAFWELWNNEIEVGCSIHQVVASLDAGDVLARDVVQVKKHSTLKGLQLELDVKGIQLMSGTVKSVMEGDARSVPQSGGGRLYRKPTLKQQKKLDVRLKKYSFFEIRLYEMLKHVYMFLAIYCNRIIISKFSANRVPVVLYHRVSDDVRDNLTVGIEQFDRQMQLLSEFYTPISIDDLLDRSFNLRGIARPVCVTFDDGYLDNYTNAVPILLKYGIPAAFFVSTGIVGSGTPFPHDREKKGIKIPNMSWDNILDMHRAGFYIGSHTVSHIDCVASKEEDLRQELEASRDEIKSRLGKNECVLAYPYGGKEHMNKSRLDVVRSTGYRACLSAYGGVNRTPIDHFNILRGGIDSSFSDLAFRYRCEGLK